MQARGVIVVPATDRLNGPWLGATRATSLQRVANRPIVCHVLDELAAAGVAEVVLLTPPDVAAEIAACIESEGSPDVQVHPLVRDYQADPAGALEALAERVGDAPVIVQRANGVLGQPLAPFLELLNGESPDLVLLVAQGARNTERLSPTSQRMLRIVEMDPANAGLGVAGVCMLGPGALRHACAVRWSPEGLELEATAERLADAGGCLQVRVVRSWRGFAGSSSDLLDMNRGVLDGLGEGPTLTETDGNRFEGRVFIDPTASVTSSVICGPVIVGAGAHIADSYIGPHTSIGERVHVEGAEIERSIILAGASIIHVGGRLVASVVGREARIFRDFSVPRAIRLQVGDGDEVALC
jgi:glucose-1-phosphate thymidylyltransferase